MKKKSFMKIGILGVTFMLLLLLGCSKVTKENYDMLKTGMLYDDVIDILGNSDECNSTLGTKKCVWGSSDKQITVHFISDKVILFSSKGL